MPDEKTHNVQLYCRHCGGKWKVEVPDQWKIDITGGKCRMIRKGVNLNPATDIGEEIVCPRCKAVVGISQSE